MARQRSVERHLARLERLELPAPGGFVAAVLAAMDAPERSTGQRSAVPAIAVAAGAAGAAALAAAWARHRFA